jgi:hypothetical protein
MNAGDADAAAILEAAFSGSPIWGYTREAAIRPNKHFHQPAKIKISIRKG